MGWNNPLTPRTLEFLRELAANNRREWFEANKSRYERDVKDAAFQLIEDLRSGVHEISPHFLAVPSLTRGSLMRIYRDTRFSRDKSPYKTNLGIRFPHRKQRDVHAPGLYVHVEPGASFVGMGAWHPPAQALGAFRDAIVDDPSGWEDASRGKPFRALFDLGGESLKRAPRGYDPDHPWIEDLKRKDFVASLELSDDEVVSEGFRDRVLEGFRAGSPFLRFLCRAVDAEF